MDHDHSRTGNKTNPGASPEKTGGTTTPSRHAGTATTAPGTTAPGTAASSRTGSTAGGTIYSGNQAGGSGTQASSGGQSAFGRPVGQPDSDKHAAMDRKESWTDKLHHDPDAAEDEARGFGEQDREPLSRYTGRLADGMSTVSSAVREKSVGQMGRDIARLARDNPAAMVIGSVAVGFVLSRFMKASTGHDSGRSPARGRLSGPEPRVGGGDSATQANRESYTTGALAEDSHVASSRPVGGDAVGLTTTAPTSPTRPSTPGQTPGTGRR